MWRILFFGGLTMMGSRFSCAEGHKPKADWQSATQGSQWQLSYENHAIPELGRVEEGVVITHPWNVPSQSGQFAQASREVDVPTGIRYGLTFLVSDDFTGPTAGYHVLQVLVDGDVVWEADVAGGEPSAREVHVDVSRQMLGKPKVTVALRVFEKQGVENFGVIAWWAAVSIQVDGKTEVLLTPPAELPAYKPYPADLPLPSLPVAGLDWTCTANVLQPWGKTQWVAVAQRQQWLSRWRDEFGFNAIIVQPPEAYNALTGYFYDKSGKTLISEDAFKEALKDYRRYGLRIILYSGIMHSGHAPAWQFGQLGKEHPDWSQRDKEGHAVTDYGAEWLCPNSPALDYTLKYTSDLLRRYSPDAIMLDNNEFYQTDTGPTCYCVHCQLKFREYVLKRFSTEQLKEFFDVTDDKVSIPTTTGPLYDLWIHWRNRVWAEANEEYRRQLRKIKPDTVLLANTAYEFPTWVLAGDLQYPHEDVLLSESRGLTSWRMSEKMVLGQALAEGRPLWNYIGTFDEKDLDRLRDPETVRLLLASNLAHAANPWIVFYGFTDKQQDSIQSLSILSQYLKWFRRNQEYFSHTTPYSSVASLLSLRSRNYRNHPLLPSHVGSLIRHQILAVGVIDEYLPTAGLRKFRHLIAEGVSCLSDVNAGKLMNWVRKGGTLITTADLAWYDELGRGRPQSAILGPLKWKGWLDSQADHPRSSQSIPFGQGRVIIVKDSNKITDVVLSALRQPVVQVEPALPEMEVTVYTRLKRPGVPSHLVIHLLNHKVTLPSEAGVFLSLRLPEGFRVKSMTQLSPETEGALPVEYTKQCDASVRCHLSRVPLYSILVLTAD